MSEDVGIGYIIALKDKAACNMDRVRYQFYKAQGPKFDFENVIEQFEDICTEIDESDEKGSCPLSAGASIAEITQYKYGHLGRSYIRSTGIKE